MYQVGPSMPKADARGRLISKGLPAGLILTKLYPPPPRPNAVTRPRLIERLNAGLFAGSQLVLISAPAGFGKTTLVSEWVAGFEHLDPRIRPTWLSLESGDNDLTRFLTYLMAALQTMAPQLGARMLPRLQSLPPPPFESVLTDLVNEITTIQFPFVLVLDDYHVIEAKPIHAALAFLLGHRPPQMHLVIATREDPDLSLARFRALGQVMELRAADLRFTPSEAAEFLNRVMGLDLSAQDLATLEDRTEGWIAGLQLAALSLQGRRDVHAFIRAFAGDHRLIVDYLVEEVLRHQPEPVRNFLLQTSILNRLNGSLCEAVTGQPAGDARLEVLERGNFFLVPLDDKRHWYRYHHLFAQVLYAHLRVEQPDQVPVLHQRASEWYEQNGSVADAIDHAVAAEDFERVACLIEVALPTLRSNRQETAVRNWLKTLPERVLRCRPVLCVAYAWALLACGELEGVETRLQDAERWLDPRADRREMVVESNREYLRLPAAIAVYRAVHAQVRGDVTATLNYARRALDLVPEDDHLVHGAAAALLGLAAWATGDLETAHRTFADGMVRLLKAGHISDAVNGAMALADICIQQGRLREAMRTYERALQLAAEQGEAIPWGTADLYVGLSELYRERNDLKTALEHLARSKELGERAGLPQNRYRWRVAMARIREAQGDLDAALDLLHEAERLTMNDYSPNVHPIAALKTRVWARQGRLSECLAWAREQGLSARDDLRYQREFEHITLARVLLTQSKQDRADHSLSEAMGLLERLLKAAAEGERKGSEIEIRMLLALAHQLRGDTPTALASLERALMLAEPEGYARIFVDEGVSIRGLLEKAAPRGIPLSYRRQLLAGLGPATDRASVKQALIEPLSNRELEVLRLLGTALNGPEIARHLMVSLNTLHTHTKSIYAKLGVNNRQAAVQRAEDLNLL